MNPDSPSPRAGDSFLRLAAYADGELDPCARSKVEQELETNPAAAEELRDQERYGPANVEFWTAVTPPMPDESCWRRVRNQIGLGLAVRSGECRPVPSATTSPRSFDSHRGTIATVVCASLLFAAFGIGWYAFQRTEEPSVVPSSPAIDPLAEIAVLPVAQPGDVMVEAVYGDEPSALSGYDSPMIAELNLAAAGDVTIEHIDAASETVRVTLSGGKDSPPMIYVAAREP